MKTLKQISIKLILSCLVMIFAAGSSSAAGLLTPADNSLPALEIKEHHVKVVIEDGYAITTVEQVFHNPHPNDLEAVYSFPVPEKAAVGEFTMWIDNTPIHGEVLEKKKARQVYEEEKAAGREAGLTEKDEYKTFEISVTPVRAGQDTRIRLGYIQPIHLDSSMGRYVYPLEEGGVDEAKLSFWTANDKVITDFSFDLILRSGYPVDGIRLPNHPAAAIVKNGDGYHVHLGNTPQSGAIAQQMKEPAAPSIPAATPVNPTNPTQPAQATLPVQPSELPAKTAGNGLAGPVFTLDQDIVVYYRHADNLPGAVDLVTHKPDKGKMGTFMLTITPAMDLKPITEGRDWVFVLDISGSMSGKYQILAEGVSKALRRMSPNERFRIILFNNSASELTSGYIQASPSNVQTYINKVQRINPASGTNVYDGLKLGLNGLDSDRTSAIMLVTDGVANVGETRQENFIKLIRSHDVRLFTFIMGNSANTPLLNAVTDASNGFAMSVSNSDDIVGSILLAKSKVTHEALHGVKLKIKGIKTSNLVPAKIGSLYRGQQLTIFGHYRGSGTATVSLSGKISGEDKVYQSSFAFPETSNTNPEVERLWGFAAIEELMRKMDNFGEDADTKQAVTDLGVQYGLVTDYTSMIVVRDEVFKMLGIERHNRDRLQREFAAQKQRAASKASNRRVDNAKPMFSGKRPTTRSSGGSGGGAGSFDLLAVLMLAPLFWFRKKSTQS